jgi:Zn-dependent protease with chaperone function
MVQSLTPEAKLRERNRERRLLEERTRKEEAFARANPVAYRRRVTFLVAVGYGYPLLVMTVCVLLYGGTFYLESHVQRAFSLLRPLANLLVFGALAIASCILIRYKKSENVEVRRADAPELYREVERISRILDTPQIKRIYLDARMNAGAFDRPRLGVLGLYQSELILGLPLLLACSFDEVRSVIAHELGHFTGTHHRMTGRVYVLSNTLENLEVVFAKHPLKLVFVPFYKKLRPVFQAVTFAMSRANEYEADQAAAKVTSSGTIGTFLMRSCFLEDQMKKEFLRPLQRKHRDLAEPPTNYFETLEQAFLVAFPASEIEWRLTAALARTTSYSDCHPCLSDRLKALGLEHVDIKKVAQELSNLPKVSGGRALIGAALDELISKVGAIEAKKVRSTWRSKYSVRERQRVMMERFMEDAKLSPPSFESSRELAIAQLTLGELEAGYKLLDHLLEQRPDDPRCLLHLGIRDLRKRNSNGLKMVRRARELDPDLTLQGVKEEIPYFERFGSVEDVTELREIQRNAQFLHALDQRERRTYKLTDQLVSPSLPLFDREMLISLLKGRAGLARAYLVDKELPSSPGKVQTCLVLVPKPPHFRLNDNYFRDYQNKLINERKIGCQVMIYAPKASKKWERRLKAIPGTELI